MNGCPYLKLKLPEGNSFCKSTESSRWPVQQATVTKSHIPLELTYYTPKRKLSSLHSTSINSRRISTLYLHHSRDNISLPHLGMRCKKVDYNVGRQCGHFQLHNYFDCWDVKCHLYKITYPKDCLFKFQNWSMRGTKVIRVQVIDQTGPTHSSGKWHVGRS